MVQSSRENECLTSKNINTETQKIPRICPSHTRSKLWKKYTFIFFTDWFLMLEKASNKSERHLHKVQKYTYAQTLEELKVTGDRFYTLLPPMIPGQFKVVAR